MKCPIQLKGGNIPDYKFNAKSLKMGMRIESEHSDIPCIQKQIAKSHLQENPNYYKILKKVNL